MNHCLLKMYRTLKINVNHSKTEPSRNGGRGPRPETDELLWQHETKFAYNEQGLANRLKPDNLPPVEWLTYGSGYLAGMKLGDTPLVEFTRDRLHRETLRRFVTGRGDTAIGAATGFIPGINVQGITAGRGSYNSIFKQMTTKASNGTIASMKPRTAAKMFVGGAVDTSLWGSCGCSRRCG